jgi:hypothetical protein
MLYRCVGLDIEWGREGGGVHPRGGGGGGAKLLFVKMLQEIMG